VFSDRLIRPGDQAYFDIIHVFNGYRTCYYRTFVVGRATQAQRDAFKQSREWMDGAIDLVKPGNTTDQIAKVWPEAEEFGFETRWTPSVSSSVTGSGSDSTNGRSSVASTHSTTPIEIKEGMVFALETYAPAGTAARPPASKRRGGHRRRAKVITLFPCEELMVANAY
jgi:Xaa-Pro aminopeptidase